MKFMQIQYRFVDALPSKQVQYLVIPEKFNNMYATYTHMPACQGTWRVWVHVLGLVHTYTTVTRLVPDPAECHGR